ncbi:ankyrin repeat-containing domain protein [Pestalotiopsis sp. NC0098]|nr:ankyrin repeat-containing domain protein [Pestalotiopsis sp. NC0098]
MMDKYTKESIDWDSYKEHIWVWYMVDNKSLSDILEILKQDGVVATKQQLEFRLKKWRVFKTIKTQEARWMAKQLDISSSAGEPIAFVKSGRILPEIQVAQAVKRHAPLPSFAQKFNTDSNAQLQLSPADLIACSPGPAGLYAKEIEPWGFHSTLPWIHFRYALLDGSIRIQTRSDARTSMPPDHLLPIIFASRSPSNSGLEVCKFASNLGQIMPEVYTREHIRRICAIAQARTSLTIDLLEILIFQLSNNFLDRDFNSDHIVHLMCAFGLDNPSTIRFLFEAADDQPTILAILDKFWRAAYETSSTRLASIIFTEFLRRYDGSDEFSLDIVCFMEKAIDTENLDLAKVILSGPKSIHVTNALSLYGTGFLAHCSGAQNHEFALAMAALLLERHDSLLKIINEQPPGQEYGNYDFDGTHTMFHALNNGNIRLARFLVEAGLNLSHRCNGEWEGPEVLYKTMKFDSECEEMSFRISIIDHETIFTAAVVPHFLREDSSRIRIQQFRKRDGVANRAESEKMVLENYLVLSEMLSEAGKLPEWLEGGSISTQPPDFDVVVLAALYGYDALLQTFVHSPSSLNQQNSNGLWPLSAAALGDNASTCHLLVRLGADPNYMPPSGDWPGPLHHAVCNNSTQLVDVLLSLGVDINYCSNLHQEHRKAANAHSGPMSALALAIALCHWNIAILLVHRGANIDALAFDLAVQSGNTTLIDLLLSRELFVYLLDRRIIEESDDSLPQIVPAVSGTANYDEPSRLQAQQITHDVLTKAVSSGSLDLVSRLLKLKAFGSNQQLLQDALACSLELGFESISRELVRAGAKLSHYDLAVCFRSCTLTSIREFMTASHGPRFWTIGRRLQGFALELAILDNTPDVVQFALEIFPQAYSSGALSAAVLRAAESSFSNSRDLMHELLLRRANVDSEQLDPILENSALATAILSQAPAEVFELLLQRSWPEMPAIYCARFSLKLGKSVICRKRLREVLLARRSIQNDFHYDDEKLIWCTKLGPGGKEPILPLTMAINLRNDQVYAKLMARGFLADRCTIEAAVKQHTSLDVLEGVLESCKEGHDIIRLWDRVLHFALQCKNDEALRYLINNGANLSATSQKSSGSFSRNFTVLQTAVDGCRSTDHRGFVQLLLDAGADVNEVPAYCRGLTALQAAAGSGHLDLARQLVNLGANINARRAVWDGLTCLEAAAQEGRLDMTQFLLDAGATTTGKGQLQYVRAVKLAREEGHSAVAQILRKHRHWDESDEALFQEECITGEYVLHPIEYTAEEIRDLADKVCLTSPYSWKYIWPKIEPPEKDGTELANGISRTHRSAEVNGPTHMSDEKVVSPTSQVAFDVLDDGSPSSFEIETEQSNSQMVVSNSMPLHTLFPQLRDDPDFHERIYEMEAD